MRTTAPIVATLLAVAANPLQADIVSVSGEVAHIAAPASVESGALSTPQLMHVFLERENVNFSGIVNRVNPPIGFDNTVTNAATVGYSGLVDSHMIHFDNIGQADLDEATGRITFDNTIVAIIFINTQLDTSDAQLGAIGTLYPGGLANRGFSGFDTIRLESPNSVFVALANGGAMDQIRVLTTVPAPSGTLALASIALFASRRRR
ncbi:MAG: hypothetical protein ACF8Q5_09540 [Phycisphaerales bacterium JB040]